MTFRIKQEPGILEGLIICEEHGCPLITIIEDGESYYVCLFETLDDMIGQESVSRVSTSEEGYLVELAFSNGYHIRPLCVCCGKPTLLVGLGDGQALRGTMLHAFGWGECGYGEDHPGLLMEFVRSENSDDVQTIPMHLDSVRSLQKEMPDDKKPSA